MSCMILLVMARRCCEGPLLPMGGAGLGSSAKREERMSLVQAYHELSNVLLRIVTTLLTQQLSAHGRLEENV